MAKQITRIVLTGGPAAGKTTLISRILKEFKQDEGWKVITIPETATELISGFGIKPFGGCVSMLDFQDFVVSDQLHKEQLALKAWTFNCSGSATTGISALTNPATISRS